MTQNKNNTKILVTCAMMVALGGILSVFPTFKGLWPNGGSITLCSMLPVIIVSYLYGLKWGFMSSAVFAVIQIMSDLRGIAGTDAMTTFWVIFLDYGLAFIVLGLGGIFKGKFNDPAKELALGSIVAIGLRFLCHFTSGYLLFSDYAEWFFTQEGFAFGNSVYASLQNSKLLFVAYSVIYNASYLLPEIIMTAIAAYIIGKSGILKKAEL
ncbi:MAG: energy-coupled thiamine transporter ThiT [Oscillospiraceae bacterium]